MGYVNSHSCLFVSIFLPILGALAVGARFAVRKYRKQGLLLDDWLSLLGLILTIGLCTCLGIGAAHQTFGAHFDPVADPKLGTSSSQWVLLRKLQWVMTLLRDSAIGFIKLSILFFYKRIFRDGCGRAFLVVNNIVIALISAWIVAYFFTCIFQCQTHLDVLWNVPGKNAEYVNVCINQPEWNTSSAVTDVIFDIIIIAIPIPIIWTLAMPWPKKIATQIVLLVGSFAVSLSIVRLVGTLQFGQPGDHLGMNSKDTIGSISIVYFWTVVEVSVAQIVTCLPSLWAAMERPGKVIGMLRTIVSASSLRTKSSSESRIDSPVSSDEKHTADRGRKGFRDLTTQDADDEQMMQDAGLARKTSAADARQLV